MLSLGLGLALLVTVIEIDGNLRRQFEGALPDKAPSFYFIDIQSADAERFDAFVREQRAGGRRSSACRCCAAASCRRTASRPTTSRRSRTPPGCCKATAASPSQPRCRAARRWSKASGGAPDYKGPPLVSFEKKIADGLGLKVGDPIVVNVLGRNIEARIANLRAVNWENLGINFVLVFSPSAFAGAPHTDIATLTYPGGGTLAQETALLKAVSDAFPAVTTVRVKDAIEAVGDIVRNLVLAVRGASLVALVAAMLVLGGALAAGHSYRVYDAVVLKTLGATRGKLIGAYALEYLLLGARHRAVRRRRRLDRGVARRHAT